MGTNEKALELKVGLFVIVGLCVIGLMVLKFGRLGQTFEKTYEVKVELPDASGLIKDAEVKMAGAKIGSVGGKPEISSNISGVVVTLKILETIKIPKKMKFQVGSTGLLGDKFVEITAGEDFDPAKFDPKDSAQVIQPGEQIKGGQPGGIDLLAREGKEAMNNFKNTLDDLRITIAKINDGILSDANQKNISEMLLNLKNTSASFEETSKNINTVVQSAQGAVDTAKQTMTTVNSAAGDLKITMEEGRKTITTAKGVMLKATQGNGFIATLLNDHELTENVKALITNLKQRGILFYKDLSTSPVKTPAPGSTSR